MSTPVSTPPEKKSNKPLIYVLVGCGGCLVLSGVAFVVLLMLGALGAKKANEGMMSGLTGLQVAAQEAQLSIYLTDDQPRLERVDEVYGELEKAAEAGEVKMEDLDKIQKEIERATNDSKLDGNEADRILDMAENLLN